MVEKIKEIDIEALEQKTEHQAQQVKFWEKIILDQKVKIAEQAKKVDEWQK